MTVTSNLPIITQRIKAKVEKYLPDDPDLTRLMFRIGALLEMEGNISYHQSGLRVRTGFLINSLRSRYAKTPDGARVDFAPWGVPYAATHEFGDPRRGIPKREYLKPTYLRASRKIAQYLEEYARGN